MFELNRELILKASSPDIEVTVALPSSKSESNRALIIRAISEGNVKIKNLSVAEDTLIMERLLNTIFEYSGDYVSSQNPAASPEPCFLDVGAAGTVMRFLTAFLSVQPGDFVLTGSPRMQKRPVGLLVEALRELGASINYMSGKGYPPLRIQGRAALAGGRVTIPGTISSQYISALLMIAPRFTSGLELEITGKPASGPYIQMTLDMMTAAGVSSNGDLASGLISIPEQSYKNTTIEIESDWSSASYWFSIAALSTRSTVFLKGLKENSLQGDRQVCRIMEFFGVEHEFRNGGLAIHKNASSLPRDQGVVPLFDFSECPDLAQTVIACAAGLGVNGSFTGLETLRIKETDRIMALDTELQKLGVRLVDSGTTFTLDLSRRSIPASVCFNTYEDHRMAMALAPLALVIPELKLEDPAVVNKSYPSFWADLSSAGFEVTLDENAWE